MSTNITCRYFNRGFCAKRDQCKYVHNNEECIEECLNSKCQLRHRVMCRDGNNCHFYMAGNCQFKHQEGEKNQKTTKKEENIKSKKQIILLTE